MFRSGISFGEFSELAKKAYVKEIEKELLKSGEKVTTSKIAIITGLTRKEVASIRKEVPSKTGLSPRHNRAVRVISGWLSAPAFCNKNGKPKILKIQGDKNSFEALVSQYSGDIPYRAMMNELIRTGAVELKDKNRVSLIRAAHIPFNDDGDGDNEKFALLGEDVPLLISTIKHNILEDKLEPRYQRKVCYPHIPEKHIKAFKKIANSENQKLLETLNHWLSKHDTNKEPASASNKTVKVGVGAYYFEEPNNATSEGTKDVT